jgi:hypothetical protein
VSYLAKSSCKRCFAAMAPTDRYLRWIWGSCGERWKWRPWMVSRDGMHTETCNMFYGARDCDIYIYTQCVIKFHELLGFCDF